MIKPTPIIAHEQYQLPPQAFNAFPPNSGVQSALGSNRTKSTQEVAEIKSTNWVPGVSGWRLTTRGLELGGSTGVFPAGAITFTDIQSIATSKILGRSTAGTGSIEQLSAASVKTILALVSGDISDFNEAAQDAVGNALVDSSTIDFTYNDGANSITASVIKVVPRVVSMADATSFTPTADTADINSQTNTQIIGTLTANAPAGTPTDGQNLMIRIKSTNAQTFSWNAVYKGNVTTALPTTSSGGGLTDKFFFQYSTLSSKWELYNAQYGS